MVKNKKNNKEKVEKTANKDNKSGSLIGKIVLGLVLIALVCGSTFLGVRFGLKSVGLDTSSNANMENTDEIESSEDEAQSFFSIGEILVNLNDDSAKRYVKLNLNVAYNSSEKELTSELENKLPLLKDAAIFYMKTLKPSDFSASNEENLKNKLVEKLNEKLTSGEIRHAVFTDLIVQ